MLRVRRSSVPVPTALDGPDSDGGEEHTAAREFYAVAGNKEKKFDFKAYKDQSVKDAMAVLFHGKCAYCESNFSATQPVDVEHFRPKGGVVIDGTLEKPGYYWLAAEWSNLLPSCIDCNRSRTQEFLDEPPHLTGKANLFPIANEVHRGREPDTEREESRLLLDPCRDRPDTHLEFMTDEDGDSLGLVRARVKSNGRPSSKGVKSIEVYGLRRLQLVRARADRLRIALTEIAHIEDIHAEIEANGETPFLKNMLVRCLAELKRLCSDEQSYSMAVRTCVKNRLGFVP